MWGEFWLAVFVGFIFLYVPAYIMLRALKFSRIASMACAPLASLLAYSILAIAFSKLGLWTNGWILSGSLCAIAVIVSAGSLLLCSYRQGKCRSTSNQNASIGSYTWTVEAGLVLLYLAVGIAVGSYVFLGSLSTADCTSYAYDDYSHLAYVRSFIERGDFSSLAANYEYDLGGDDRYYPAAWHLLSASIITICNVPLYVGTNAAIFLCCTMIYPLSCLFLMRRLFKNEIGMQITGAFLTLVFASFPWEFVYYGRLVSNLLAFCFVPLMLGCTMFVFCRGVERTTRIRFALVLLCSFILSVFTQPSVCFTWIVFSVPYLMHLIWNAKNKDGNAYKLARKIVHVGAFCLMVFLFLIFCYMLPFLYSVTRFKWRAPMSPLDAFELAIVQGCPAEGFMALPFAPILALLVFAGIYFAVRRSKTRWIVLLWGILLIMYVISAGTNWSLKNYMTGWWYTDSHRVYAMYSIASYVLAVIGLGSMTIKAWSRVRKGNGLIIAQGCTACLITCIALAPSFSVGDFTIETPISTTKKYIGAVYDANAPDEVLYSQKERVFVEEAAEITGDAKVFNIPKDGSLFAYASSGMRTLYRWDLAELSNDASTRIVQRSLDDLASDQSVRNAVDDLGFEYVLLLDKGHEPPFSAWGGLSYRDWVGPTSISESTPGFELVLSEDDMELYRVLSPNEIDMQKESVEQ